MKVVKKTTITIVCQGGWKYTGELIDNSFSAQFGSGWLKLRTQNKVIVINTSAVVSIIYGNE
jgi:hypothetical protein